MGCCTESTGGHVCLLYWCTISSVACIILQTHLVSLLSTRQICKNNTILVLSAANEPLVLLVDEAQLLWNQQRSNSTLFWEALKRIDEGCSGVRVILAAAYGTKRSAADDTGSGGSSPGSVATPAGVVRPGRNIYLHRGDDGYGLVFGEVEWEEVCSAFELQNPDLKLEPLIRQNIYNSCAGQVSKP